MALPDLADAFVRYFQSPEMRNLHGEAARAQVESDLEAKKHALVLQDEMLPDSRQLDPVRSALDPMKAKRW